MSNFKQNKALDLNKLFIQQGKGKLLKKHIKFPMYYSIKYDGNAVVVIKEAQGLVTYMTSGGHIYDHDKPTIFDCHTVSVGVYIAERIGTDGKLGDRKRCNLRGQRGYQTSYGHSYKVHDMLTVEDFEAGKSLWSFEVRLDNLIRCSGISSEHLVENDLINNQEELDILLKKTVENGFEGVMGKSPNWYWKDTKSRTVDLIKYKKRKTVDLLCIGATEGTGKYTGMIGSLRLTDKAGRIVDTGSGMTDEERHLDPSYFIGQVIEVYYETIMDTYIQPTFGDEYEGVLIREDKTKEDID